MCECLHVLSLFLRLQPGKFCLFPVFLFASTFLPHRETEIWPGRERGNESEGETVIDRQPWLIYLRRETGGIGLEEGAQRGCEEWRAFWHSASELRRRGEDMGERRAFWHSASELRRRRKLWVSHLCFSWVSGPSPQITLLQPQHNLKTTLTCPQHNNTSGPSTILCALNTVIGTKPLPPHITHGTSSWHRRLTLLHTHPRDIRLIDVLHCYTHIPVTFCSSTFTLLLTHPRDILLIHVLHCYTHIPWHSAHRRLTLLHTHPHDILFTDVLHCYTHIPMTFCSSTSYTVTHTFSVQHSRKIQTGQNTVGVVSVGVTS